MYFQNGDRSYDMSNRMVQVGYCEDFPFVIVHKPFSDEGSQLFGTFIKPLFHRQGRVQHWNFSNVVGSPLMGLMIWFFFETLLR